MTIQEEENIRPKLNEEKNKNKNKKNKKKKKKSKENRGTVGEVVQEFAFVLGLPFVFNHVGEVLQEFIDIGLKLIDLRCMSVTTEFIQAHFQKESRYTFTGPVMDFVTDDPFLAMKLQGDDAVYKAHQLVFTKRRHPFWDRWKNLVINLPDGSTCSGSTVEEIEEKMRKVRIDFDLDCRNQRFVLIKPKAFQDGIMPKMLSRIERICCYIKGLKLVKKSEVPHSVAWSDDSSSSLNETHKEEFGIALIVVPPWISFNIRRFLTPRGRCYQVNIDLVYVSPEGESLKFVKEFFEFGVVGWFDSVSNIFCGGKFEPTLTGLLYEDDSD
ncbi:hypothetical protein MKX01_003740 [Papaver californicum]|nr:hypothetical protein MKX01_003740 [Papaver californicum]